MMIKRYRVAKTDCLRVVRIALLGFMSLAIFSCSSPPELSSLETSGNTDAKRAKPNILLILVDDLGFNDLAINNGNTAIQTPNMDQLSREGMRFTRHYASPVCNPARAALLTGLYPERLGFLPSGRGISPEVITLPESLQRAGYATAHIGKWHAGDTVRGAWPDRQGFEYWLGFLHQWQLAGVKRKDGELAPAGPRYETPYLRGSAEPGKHYDGHLETILTREALVALDSLREQGRPWFLNLWYYAPHTPISPAAEFADRYPDTHAGRYQALVNQLDHNIGLVIQKLADSGELDNTIVVLASDNGGTNQAMNNNEPFFGKKATLNEGALRTPLVIRWPDSKLNGRVVSAVFSIQDIYPTLLEAIGEPAPVGLDGRSHYASLTGQGDAPSRELFWEFGQDSFAVLSADGRWFLRQPITVWGVESPVQLLDQTRPDEKGRGAETDDPRRISTMLAAYDDWYRDVHTVNTRQQQDEGENILTGFDFLRAPGFGPYTIGLGVSDEVQGTLASQENAWEITRTGSRIKARFGELTVSGEVATDDDCHRVVVTGYFHRSARRDDSRHTMEVTLFINEEVVQTKKETGVVPLGDLAAPIYLGRAAGDDSHRVRRAVVLNARLDEGTPWSLPEFSRSLCAASPNTEKVGELEYVR